MAMVEMPTCFRKYGHGLFQRDLHAGDLEVRDDGHLSLYAQPQNRARPVSQRPRAHLNLFTAEEN